MWHYKFLRLSVIMNGMILSLFRRSLSLQQV